jgi:hypothetical protein
VIVCVIYSFTYFTTIHPSFIVQGLSNRRIGATSINSESSRSHTVFTCVVESRCKVIHFSLMACRLCQYVNLFNFCNISKLPISYYRGILLRKYIFIPYFFFYLGNCFLKNLYLGVIILPIVEL